MFNNENRFLSPLYRKIETDVNSRITREKQAFYIKKNLFTTNMRCEPHCLDCLKTRQLLIKSFSPSITVKKRGQVSKQIEFFEKKLIMLEENIENSQDG